MRRKGEPALPGKLTIRVADRKLILQKRSGESERHVLLKALFVARYLDAYPSLLVEKAVGLRFVPDLVAHGGNGTIEFWGECGETAPTKIGWLLRSFPEAHIAFARQAGLRDTFPGIVEEQASRVARHGTVEVVTYGDEAWDAIRPDGSIDLAGIVARETRIEPKGQRRRAR